MTTESQQSDYEETGNSKRQSSRHPTESGMDSRQEATDLEGVEFRSSDMTTAMRQEALRVAKDAAQRFKVTMDIANEIKVEFDKRHKPHWHCVVGSSFGTKFVHDEGCFIYFCIIDNGKKLYVLLWKVAQLK